MTIRNPIGFREYPCPDDSVSDEDTVRAALDEYDADTIAAYSAFASDKLDQPIELVASLVPGLVGHQRWESHRGLIGRLNPELAEYLNVIAYDIDKLQAAFIEHEAERRLKVAEEIKHEEAA